MKTCAHCEQPHGRRGKFCSDVCKQAAYRRRKDPLVGSNERRVNRRDGLEAKYASRRTTEAQKDLRDAGLLMPLGAARGGDGDTNLKAQPVEVPTGFVVEAIHLAAPDVPVYVDGHKVTEPAPGPAPLWRLAAAMRALVTRRKIGAESESVRKLTRHAEGSPASSADLPPSMSYARPTRTHWNGVEHRHQTTRWSPTGWKAPKDDLPRFVPTLSEVETLIGAEQERPWLREIDLWEFRAFVDSKLGPAPDSIYDAEEATAISTPITPEQRERLERLEREFGRQCHLIGQAVEQVAEKIDPSTLSPEKADALVEALATFARIAEKYR